jgi:phosphoribosyl-ATP pyrophosphohydrolase/phosphoribosyl-AMP cyclohydrolase
MTNPPVRGVTAEPGRDNHCHRHRSIGEDGHMQGTVNDLEEVLRQRRAQRPAGSYSAQLFDDPVRIQRKIMEEAFEVCLELGRPDRDPDRVVAEAADLVFHLLVGLVDSDVSIDAVLDELARRRR